MPDQLHSGKHLPERAGYFEVLGAHLYTVLHEAKNPITRVLLVGPFASERHSSYLPWVRWARYLAVRNIEVLRYDYRGVGESTGIFDEMTFEDWRADVRLLSGWLERRLPHAPLLLHGLGLGAILAGRAFHDGIGNALLLWSPPNSANDALRSTLLRVVALEQLFKYGDARVSAYDYIRQLEQGASLEVEGYSWSARLWRESFDIHLPGAMLDEQSAANEYKKPIRIVKLDRRAAPLAKGGFVGYDDVKDFSWLFAPNFNWISDACATSRRSRR